MTSTANSDVLIVGAGIGGLTAALCCAARGMRVQVLEQAAVLSAAGAGIQLSPNCTRVLHDLGLESALRAVAFLPEGTQFRHWRTGKVISESVLGERALQKFGAPYYHIHRGDLLEVLAQAVARQKEITLQTGCLVSDLHDHDESVEVVSNERNYRSAVVVGADGIHSSVRDWLWNRPQGSDHAEQGSDEGPQFTGNIAWRALVPVDRLPAGLVRPMSSVWWGPGKHFVHYYVRGGSLVNCVCVVEKSGWEVESWTEPGDLNELKADFSGWHDSLQQLMDQAEPDSLFKWGLFDRKPMQQWGRGRVTLLGDACHPTLPFMAQGAAMAIEDAAVLAGSLHRTQQLGGVTAALQHYEDKRRDRTAMIQAGSRRNAQVFHLSGIKAWARNRAAGRAGGRTIEKLYAYDALRAADS